MASAVLVSQTSWQDRKNPLIKGCNCFVISEIFKHNWYCISIKANSSVPPGQDEDEGFDWIMCEKPEYQNWYYKKCIADILTRGE